MGGGLRPPEDAITSARPCGPQRLLEPLGHRERPLVRSTSTSERSTDSSDAPAATELTLAPVSSAIRPSRVWPLLVTAIRLMKSGATSALGSRCP